MTSLQAGRQSAAGTVLGILLFVTFAVLFWNILQVPRTALDQRETMRLVHDSVGLLVMLLAGASTYWFLRGPKPSAPRGLPESSFSYNRLILLFVYLTFLVTGVIGFAYAWGEFDREIVLFGWHVPPLVADNDGVRKTYGYLHSALGFYYLFLFSIWIVYGIYQQLRYRAGWRRLFPGSRV